MFNLGSKITITRGRKGEKPDFYPGTVVSEPKHERVNGRLVTIAQVITAQRTLAGDLRLVSQPHDLGFAFPVRMTGDEWVEMLDGPKSQPKSVGELIRDQAVASIAYLNSRPEALDSIDLAAVNEASA